MVHEACHATNLCSVYDALQVQSKHVAASLSRQFVCFFAHICNAFANDFTHVFDHWVVLWNVAFCKQSPAVNVGTSCYKTLIDWNCFHLTVFDLNNVPVSHGLLFAFLGSAGIICSVVFCAANQSSGDTTTAPAGDHSLDAFGSGTTTAVLRCLLGLLCGALTLQHPDQFNQGSGIRRVRSIRKTEFVLRR